jgi:hypothetical protein
MCVCFQSGGSRRAIMFLVEAALGKEHLITQDDSSLKAAPPGYDCIIAKGQQEPDASGDEIIDINGNKVVVPTVSRAWVLCIENNNGLSCCVYCYCMDEM